MLLSELQGDDDALSQLAIDILATHPECVTQSMQTLDSWWQTKDPQSLASLKTLVAYWVRDEAMIQKISDWLANASLTSAQQEALASVIRQVQGSELPEKWNVPLTQQLSTDEVDGATLFAQSLRNVKWRLPRDQTLVKGLVSLANDAGSTFEQRLKCIEALPLDTVGIDESTLSRIADAIVSREEPISSQSVSALPHVRLHQPATEFLLSKLETIAPLQLEEVVLAILRSSPDSSPLLNKFSSLPAAKSVSTDRILQNLKSHPTEIQKQWRATLERIQAPPEDIAQAVDDWIGKLPEGDPIRGYHVFRDNKSACSACHRVGYVGGRIGPELTRIGRSRTRRDLVEAILFPSARLEQSYQPTRILTTDGKVFNGLIANQTATTLELICGANERCFVAVEDIELREPSPVSVMPAGLEQVLTVEQLADLISFLESAR